MSSKRLKLAHNPELINKNDSGRTDLFAHGWKNDELTLEQLVDTIKKGNAYTAQLTGPRRAANFLASDVLSVDIDRGMTIEQVRAHPLVTEHAAFLYTTVNHSSQAPRLRAVFIAPSTIESAAEMRAALRSLALRLNGDPSATDPARIFYGNTNAKVIRIDKQMGERMLIELVAQSENAIKTGGKSRQVAATSRSALNLDPKQTIKLASGEWQPFFGIAAKTPVHCPYHADQHASGLVVLNRNGVRGLHCSACADTFWPADTKYDIDFYGLDRAVKEAHGRAVKHRDYGAFGEFFNEPDAIPGLLGSNIRITDAAGPLELLPGITFVKAPKGAGKTATMGRLLANARSALLVGHRRSLIRQSCVRLGLACYLDAWEWKLSGKRIGVCFDSLDRIKWGKQFDVVVVDEVEQVLAHVLADTVEQRKGGGRERLFKQLDQLIANAKCVVALDADLGWTSFNALVRMKAAQLPDPTQGDLFEQMRPAVRLVLNENKTGIGKAVEVYRSRPHLVAEIMRCAAAGARLFVTANSKALVEKIAGAMAKELPDIRRIIMTSETVPGEAQRAFLESPATETLKYDVIFASPAVGTGVDITFPERATLIDVVFGFCEADITTHWDFDQQIARVRQPGAVKVWLSPKLLHYETHPDVVRRELWEGSVFKHLLIDTKGPGGTPRYVEDDQLIDLASQVISHQRASKNALRANFVAYKQWQGFTVRFVDGDPGSRREGTELLRLGEKMSLAAHANSIIAAEPLRTDLYHRVKWAIQAGVQVPDNLRLSYARTQLELFYRRAVSEELIAIDDRRRYRARIKMFEQLMSPMSHWRDQQPVPRQAMFLRAAGYRLDLILNLLRASGLLADNGFDGAAVVDGTMMTEFIRFTATNKGAIENQLGMEVRRDLERKPISQLKAVLRLAGLDLVKAEIVKTGGQKIYRYRLDPERLKRARAVVDARQRMGAWRFVAQLHGWAGEDDLELDEGDFDASA